jgi:uncharacterized membrane protein
VASLSIYIGTVASDTAQKIYRWPLFTLLAVCFAGAILGDSTAEALLLARFGPEWIPRLYLINALLLCISSAVMMSVIDKVDRGVFFCGFWGCMVVF